MAEQFHQWVNNMPWWEKLYYQLFDPNAISCSTYTTVPIGGYIIGMIVAVTVLYVGLHYFTRSTKLKS